MRVPLSWLSELVDLGSMSADQLADVLTMAGLEVEEIVRPTAGARGVVIVEVEDVAPVPGSDKLSLVHATDGRTSHEIVCGARNFAPGDRVPAALPGAVLPGGIEIGRKRLFGVTSNGMLASARELGVGADHSGIWVLDPDAPVGADLNDWLDLDDPVIVLELTPDRGYALSLHGIARDVAAMTGAELRLPELPGNPGGDPGVPVTIEDPAACSRFDARAITGFTIGRSPAHIQRRLAMVGMRSISNVVDATNLAMIETGHPVHPYDRQRLRGPAIVVRRARPGETLRTLDDVVRTLDPEDLVIADAEGPIGLAGIMGGGDSEISDSTTELLVEVAAFDPVTVLRTGRRHGLATEARTRFERTVPPETVGYGASRVAQLIVELAGGRVVGGSDTYPAPPEPRRVPLRPARAQAFIGVDLPAARQRELLARIACEVTGDGEELTVTPPAYRPDLQIEEDLYEEIARLHGYDKIPPRVPSSGQSGHRSPQDQARLEVRRALVGAGWTEVLLFPFIADRDLEKLEWTPDDPRRQTLPLVNPLSKEEAVLRTSLLPGLLKAVRRNANRGQGDLALFEVGHVFLPPGPDAEAAPGGPTGVTLPAEPDVLGLAACGAFETRRHDRPARQVDLQDLLGAVEVVRRTVGADELRVERTTELPYHPGRAARVAFGDLVVGVVGELHPRICQAYDVPARTLVGELRLDRIVADGIRLPQAHVPSPLPGLRFDVAVQVADEVPHADVAAAIRRAAGPRLTALTLFDVYTGAQVGEGNKSLAFSLVLDDPDQQLTDAEEAAAIDAIEEAVAALGGRLRR